MQPPTAFDDADDADDARPTYDPVGAGEECESDGNVATFCRELERALDLPTVLRTLRTRQQLTLQEVGDLTGLSRPYIDRIEHGLRTPERDTLICLLLAGYILPVPLANRVLIFAGHAPLPHRLLATRYRAVGAGREPPSHRPTAHGPAERRSP